MILSLFPSGKTQKLPQFTYTGSYAVVGGGATWAIKFLTGGILTLASPRAIDLFMVGGGGGGSYGGGGGGYTSTVRGVAAKRNVAYPIVVGAGGAGGYGNVSPGDIGKDGGATSAFGHAANGGKGAGLLDRRIGGNGGSGGGGGEPYGNAGAGGSDGSKGGEAYGNAGQGQGSTTREFGEAGATLYAGGGGGGSGYDQYPNAGGAGGAGGGGRGGNGFNAWGTAGTVNTGGGGGGGYGVISGSGAIFGSAGGSGIVIIRNKR